MRRCTRCLPFPNCRGPRGPLSRQRWSCWVPSCWLFLTLQRETEPLLCPAAPPWVAGTAPCFPYPLTGLTHCSWAEGHFPTMNDNHQARFCVVTKAPDSNDSKPKPDFPYTVGHCGQHHPPSPRQVAAAVWPHCHRLSDLKQHTFWHMILTVSAGQESNQSPSPLRPAQKGPTSELSGHGRVLLLAGGGTEDLSFWLPAGSRS